MNTSPIKKTLYSLYYPTEKKKLQKELDRKVLVFVYLTENHILQNIRRFAFIEYKIIIFTVGNFLSEKHHVVICSRLVSSPYNSLAAIVLGGVESCNSEL